MAFPKEEKAARALVDEHNRKIPDDRVMFAAYYSPNGRDPYILEVLQNFGYGEIGDDEDLMDTQFKPFGAFARSTRRPVHLVLTNPSEFRHAIQNDWPGIKLLEQAKSLGNFEVLLRDPSFNINF